MTMTYSNAVSVIWAFTVSVGGAKAKDRHVFAMSAVVYTPTIVTTLEKVRLSAGTTEIVKPNRS